MRLKPAWESDPADEAVGDGGWKPGLGQQRLHLLVRVADAQVMAVLVVGDLLAEERDMVAVGRREQAAARRGGSRRPGRAGACGRRGCARSPRGRRPGRTGPARRQTGRARGGRRRGSRSRGSPTAPARRSRLGLVVVGSRRARDLVAPLRRVHREGAVAAAGVQRPHRARLESAANPEPAIEGAGIPVQQDGPPAERSDQRVSIGQLPARAVPSGAGPVRQPGLGRSGGAAPQGGQRRLTSCRSPAPARAEAGRRLRREDRSLRILGRHTATSRSACARSASRTRSGLRASI